MPELAVEQLRRGLAADDARFDRLYPDWARRLSNVHWTPVMVAARAAQLLVTRPDARVLDVGSGVGKLCLVGALVTRGRFYGVEQVASLVHAARAAAARLQATQARYLHGDMTAIDWQRFDAFYLYNPFADLEARAELPDGRRGVDPALFDASVRFVSDRLAAARAGTRVVTYHGFGGAMPASYRLELAGEGELAALELWTKRADR